MLAGIGNIYADESLWGAKIHPATRVKDVSEAKLKNYSRELRYVLELSIEKGGSTDKNYVNAEGKKGSYIDFARVFRQEGRPCKRHPETLIEKIRVAGRGTHICPNAKLYLNDGILFCPMTIFIPLFQHSCMESANFVKYRYEY